MEHFVGNRVLLWRLGGAIICANTLVGIFLVVLTIIWNSVIRIIPLLNKISSGNGLTSSKFWVATCVHQTSMPPVLLGYALSLSVEEPVLKTGKVFKYIPAMLSVMIMRIGSRLSTLEGAMKQLVFCSCLFLSGALMTISLNTVLRGESILEYCACGNMFDAISACVCVCVCGGGGGGGAVDGKRKVVGWKGGCWWDNLFVFPCL